MTASEERNILTDAELAHLKEIDSDELRGKFPGMPEIEPGTKLWAVFAADGRPIMLTDARDTALAGVLQNDLTPVSIH